MNDYKLQYLKEQRSEICELLALFERAAFRPDDGNNGGDPTAALNGIYETRIALQTKGAAFILDESAAKFFWKLQRQLEEIENNVRRKYPQVFDLAIQWRGKPINTQERIASIRQSLGDIYTPAACFIRAEAFNVYRSPEDARPILAALDRKIKQLMDCEDKTPPQIIRILFLAADPTDASRLRLGTEFRELQEKLKLAKLRDDFKLELPQLSVRPADISQALLDTQPQIVHFSGHGTATGALCFESQTGQTQLVQPDALAALFEQFTSQVNCVLLNACYSEIQAKAIAEHIEYVIGMNKAIGDEAAIAFAIGFYQALGAGRTVEEAYKLGCVQIRLQSIPEHLTPVLIKKEQQAAA